MSYITHILIFKLNKKFAVNIQQIVTFAGLINYISIISFVSVFISCHPSSQIACYIFFRTMKTSIVEFV